MIGRSAGFFTELCFTLPLGSGGFLVEDYDAEIHYTELDGEVEIEDVTITLDNREDYSIMNLLTELQMQNLYEQCYEREASIVIERDDD